MVHRDLPIGKTILNNRQLLTILRAVTNSTRPNRTGQLTLVKHMFET